MVPGGARFISFHGIREIQDSVGGGEAVRGRFRRQNGKRPRGEPGPPEGSCGKVQANHQRSPFLWPSSSQFEAIWSGMPMFEEVAWV